MRWNGENVLDLHQPTEIAVESAAETFVPNFSLFILPAVLAQLHVDVLWRFFSNAWFMQGSDFSTYFLLSLPLIPLNNNLPKPTIYIYIYEPAPYLQRRHSHPGVLVSRQVNLQLSLSAYSCKQEHCLFAAWWQSEILSKHHRKSNKLLQILSLLEECTLISVSEEPTHPYQQVIASGK